MEEVRCIKDWGIILGGKNSVEVDMIAAKLLKAKKPKEGVDTLKTSRSLFGNFDANLISQIPKSLEIEY